MTPTNDNWGTQLFWLFVLAVPIACVARTVVFEEVFREPREFCRRKSESAASFALRKFFYLFTCEYCFSHYVTIAFLFMTRYKLLINDWRGYVIAFFALVMVANAYMNLYARLRVDITSEKKAIEHKEREIEAVEKDIEAKEHELRKKDAETTEAMTRS
jgi:type VI protein secretion system component VasK